jgi:heterodisulfide reductase subunit B
MNKELEMLKELEKNIKFFNERYEEIKKKYKGKWIVIKNKKIVLVGNNLDKIYKTIKIKKINIDGALIEYIPEKQEAWII